MGISFSGPHSESDIRDSVINGFILLSLSFPFVLDLTLQMATPKELLKAARRAKFEAVFVKIRDELIEHFSGEGMPQEAVEWYRNVRAC